MKTQAKSFLPFRITAVIFYSLILLTMFMPLLSLDKYIEYEFHDTQYYGQYQSYTTPLSSKIRPLDLIRGLTFDEKEVAQLRKQYTSMNNKLKMQYEDGKITQEEYDALRAEDPLTNTFYMAYITNGSSEFARIQDKVHLISMVMIVMYSFVAILLLFNIFNLVFNAKFIYITNAQASWIYATATLIFIIYIFSTVFSNNNELHDNEVVETTMYCLSANGTFIGIFIAEALFSVVSLIVSAKFSKSFTYIEEVPEFISYRIKQETKKPYLAPRNASPKPKAYYTKKHKKKKKKKHGKKR